MQLRQLASDTRVHQAHHKACHNPTLAHVLDFFWCLVECEEHRRREMVTLSQSTGEILLDFFQEARRTLTERIAEAITLLDQCRTSPRERSYATLFYEAIEMDGFDQIRLTEEKVRKLRQLLSSFLTFPYLKCRLDHEQLVEKALLFIEFLETHRVDPHSTLLGLRASHKIVELLVHRHALSPFDVENAEDLEISPTDLFEHMHRWSESTLSAEQIVEQLKAYMIELRGVPSLEEGAIIIYRGEDQVFRYGRFLSSCDHRDTITIIINARDEQKNLASKDVWPLSPSVEAFILHQPFQKYDEELVLSPFDGLFKERMEYINQLKVRMLARVRVDSALLQRAEQHQCTVFDSVPLRDAIQQLQQSLPPPPNLLVEVEDELSAIRTRYLSHWNEQEVFRPTRALNMEVLDRGGSNAQLEKTIKNLEATLDMAVGMIEMKKRGLGDGTRKNKLASSWLKDIHDRVLERLVDNKLNPEAVPPDYTMSKPVDLAQVFRNHEILKKALDQETDPFDILGLIKELSNVVYTNIDAFIVDATFAILDVCETPITLDQVPDYPPSKLKAAIAELRDKDTKWMNELALDIEYLLTMKAMETASLEVRRANFHVVPVSGLVWSVLCRMENEHNTVIELWAPVDYVRRVSDYARPALHRAISIRELSKIEAILKNHPEEKNERDELGWTPLHMASTTENRLKICKKLLNTSVVVDIPNNDGNTPLHFLSRCQVEESAQLKHTLMQRMISQGADPNSVNDKGETPLFGACLIGDISAVRVLLESHADPNISCKDGSTCLHIAVQHYQEDLVRILLQYRASISASWNGESPADLAYKFHCPAILRVLLEEGGRSEKLKTSLSAAVPENRSVRAAKINKLQKMPSLAAHNLKGSF